jgi:hypothetical protein
LEEQLKEAEKGREQAEKEVMGVWDAKVEALESVMRKEEDVAGRLFIEEQRMIKLKEEYDKVRKTKVLERFYCIEKGRKQNDWMMNGEVMSLSNLSAILPVIDCIIEEAKLRGYERKYIKSLYL